MSGEYAFSVGPVPDFVQVSSLAERWDDNAPGHDDKTWRLFEEEQVNHNQDILLGDEPLQGAEDLKK